MAGETSDDGQDLFRAAQERVPALAWLARLDDAIYRVERIAVTTAGLVMSAAVCLTILYQFAARELATVRRIGTEASVGDLWPIGVLVLGVFLIAKAVWVRSPSCKDNSGLATVLALIATLGAALFVVALVTLPSKVITALTILVSGAFTTLVIFDAPRPIPPSGVDVGRKRAMILTLVLTLVAMVVAFITIPPGYSWTTKLALLLLLWSAFIGASMATHDGRHLSIDAIRKAVPARAMPVYEAISNLAAAIFSAGFAWLAWLYLQGRLGELPTPGEIPDWLKVAAIPVALAFVTLRFTGRAVNAGAVAFLAPKSGEEQR